MMASGVCSGATHGLGLMDDGTITDAHENKTRNGT